MREHNYSMLICDQCPFTSFRKSTLRIHKKKYQLGNRIVQKKLNHCTLYPKSWNTVKGLNEHKERIHQEIRKSSEIVCKLCDKELFDKYKLTSHNNAVRSNIRNISCSKCEQKLNKTRGKLCRSL